MEDHERLENSGNRGCIRLSYDEFFVFGINRNSAERSPSPTKKRETTRKSQSAQHFEENSDKSSDEKFPRYKPLE